MLIALVSFDASVGASGSIYGIWESGLVRGMSPIEWANRSTLYRDVPVLVSKSKGDLTHLSQLGNAVKA